MPVKPLTQDDIDMLEVDVWRLSEEISIITEDICQQVKLLAVRSGQGSYFVDLIAFCCKKGLAGYQGRLSPETLQRRFATMVAMLTDDGLIPDRGAEILIGDSRDLLATMLERDRKLVTIVRWRPDYI